MSAVIEARASWQEIERKFESESGLTSGQYAILYALVKAGEPLNMKQVSAMVPVDKSTCSEIVYRLAEKGYVTTEPSKTDRRAILVKLTRKGRGMFLRAERVDARLSNGRG